MRFWGKVKREHKIIKDAEAESLLKRDQLTDEGIELLIAQLCREMDLSRPVILKKNFQEIKDFGLTVFKASDFIEAITFDALEIELLNTKKAQNKSMHEV